MKAEEIESKVRMILQDFRRRNDYPLTKAVPDMLALLESQPKPAVEQPIQKENCDCSHVIGANDESGKCFKCGETVTITTRYEKREN